MSLGKAILDGDVPVVLKARSLQGFDKHADALVRLGLRGAREITDLRQFGLLRPHRDRPRRRAAEKRDEIAPPDHSITSSAAASSDADTVRPSTLAVLRLITNSTLVDCWTGRSAGFSPLSIRPI